MIVTDERVPQFAADNLSVSIFPPMECIGWERGGEVTVAAILNCFTGPSIELTVAGGPWPRALVRRIGGRVFGELGCSRMGFTTESADVVSITKRCGARIEGIARDFYGEGRDGIMLGVLAKDWKFK